MKSKLRIIHKYMTSKVMPEICTQVELTVKVKLITYLNIELIFTVRSVYNITVIYKSKSHKKLN